VEFAVNCQNCQCAVFGLFLNQVRLSTAHGGVCRTSEFAQEDLGPELKVNFKLKAKAARPSATAGTEEVYSHSDSVQRGGR
jgi:hypothetical protein